MLVSSGLGVGDGEARERDREQGKEIASQELSVSVQRMHVSEEKSDLRSLLVFAKSTGYIGCERLSVECVCVFDVCV